MIFSFCGWSSGISSSAESTSETLGNRARASRFWRSSSRELALASAATPERPAEARMRRSQATDSVPGAWRFNKL